MSDPCTNSVACLRPAHGADFEWIRWRLYAVLSASFFLGFFYRMAPGVVADDLMAAFDTTAASLGAMVAMYFYIYTVMQIPAGMLADGLGPRASASIGALIAGAGSLLFGLAPTFEAAAIGRFLMGLGTSTIFIGLLKINTTWFRDRSQGAANGLAMLLGNLGSVLAASPFAALLAFISWRSAFTGSAVMSVILGVLTWMFVRNRPELAGYTLGQQRGDATAAPAATGPSRRKRLRAVFASRQAWAGFGAQFGAGGAFFCFAGLWGVPLMQQAFGLSRTRAALYPTLAIIGLAFGAFAFGWLSDRVGRRKPFVVGGPLISGLLWVVFILGFWSPGWTGLTLCFLIGLTASATSVAYTAARETVAPGQAGLAMAMVNTGLFLGVAVSQPVFGGLLDMGWQSTLVAGVRHYSWDTFRQALLLFVGFCGLSLLSACFLRETYATVFTTLSARPTESVTTTVRVVRHRLGAHTPDVPDTKAGCSVQLSLARRACPSRLPALLA